jgi:hypothetical protein
MSTELPVRTPVVDTRERIKWGWNDVLKANTDRVVVALAAVIVVVLLLASLTLPKAVPISPEFWIGP